MIIEKVYLPKELSWLSFNQRVLQEAADESNPLIERIRFLGIYSSNLDEFYKVQFANLKKYVLIEQEQAQATSNAKHLLRQVNQKVIQLELQFDQLYNELLLEMARNQIFLINERQLTTYQETWIKNYYKQNLRQYITPILLDSHTELIQFLKDDHAYLAVEIICKDSISYALLELPTDNAPRFVLLPSEVSTKNKSIIFLDNILRYCLADIFKVFFDAVELNAYSININRDAEYELNTELDSLLELMSQGLKQRLTAQPVRFTYQKDMPKALFELLINKLRLTEQDAMPGGRYPNFKDLANFPDLGVKNLLNKRLPSLAYNRFKKFRNAFATIKDRDVLLYYPYYSFGHVLEIMRQASFDPAVTHIRMNIYRVAKDSRFIHAAINAANNGKKVTVVVELQARFDEEANIKWAKRLIRSGIKVIYSQPKLKIHAKLFLIDRKEDDRIVRYAHIGSGNFNEKTARIYTDFSLLTADPAITDEVIKVFNFIENPFKPVTFHHLLVSPQNTRLRFHEFIEREINNAKAGKPSGIYLKLNAITDKEMINQLYKASCAGVKIRMIVRGTCILVPQIPNLSENIYVTSIVDQYLEHARVYIFENDGNKDTYISSADWMPRNLDNRIEVGVKIFDLTLKSTIHNIFNIQCNDNVKARIIDKDNMNNYVQRGNKKKVRAQRAIYDYLKQLESAS
ncbi:MULTISPECIES: polyphosphate kinase 1 [unclassified Gilliamella]|uniref:polyphosphate kinase 1 n=1 Tax=unclassified Gilliamella TaxID=2685620 RepID=UPI00080E20B5|nr:MULTISPECIES: polyphosphate kinase 1 [Gilliamella]MCX8582649.1 polyphosphate kinase 1 [Gilliamella sp. B3372]MCX8585335.1 polyphosphate kinase 1 [Gilliamella sp. B3562]MCX8594268.1 polyphosphate kinase 1 [Gilliamella sp. B3367]MCX8596463.1 polyphosphate kinase 1 [Gilliamella sp. B3493]MCX8599269.1 polyphosphate kinase 1 [Gilliamella sp. B3486]